MVVDYTTHWWKRSAIRIIVVTVAIGHALEAVVILRVTIVVIGHAVKNIIMCHVRNTIVVVGHAGITIVSDHVRNTIVIIGRAVETAVGLGSTRKTVLIIGPAIVVGHARVVGSISCVSIVQWFLPISISSYVIVDPMCLAKGRL